MITIVDYKMANIGSITNMLKRLNVPCEVSADARTIENASKLLLPGVGTFDSAVNYMHLMGLFNVLKEKISSGNTPTLGICLGMQLLGDRSDEGTKSGLGIIPGVVRKFTQSPEYKVPHMGWNQVKLLKSSPLFEGLNKTSTRFYFVHSFYFDCTYTQDRLTTTNFEIDFTSSISKGLVAGVQFHPEKSHRYGMRLLQNFAKYF